MNFLNIGTMELMVIIAIAILVIGPQRMVQVARTIGRMATRMRQISGEFTSILRSEFAELDDARQEVQGAIGEIAGGRGKASAAAEVTGAVGGAKAEADQSMESLLEDGLGLGQIAAELRATATEARQFVRKASKGEAIEDNAVSSDTVEAPRDEGLTTGDDSALDGGAEEQPGLDETEMGATAPAIQAGEGDTGSLEEDSASSHDDAVETNASSESDEIDEGEDDPTEAAEVDGERPPDVDKLVAVPVGAAAETPKAEFADESPEVSVPAPSLHAGNMEATSVARPDEPQEVDERSESDASELDGAELGVIVAAERNDDPNEASLAVDADPEAGREDV